MSAIISTSLTRLSRPILLLLLLSTLVAQRSHLIADHIAAGTLGIIGATYNLRDGEAGVVTAIGIDVT